MNRSTQTSLTLVVQPSSRRHFHHLVSHVLSQKFPCWGSNRSSVSSQTLNQISYPIQRGNFSCRSFYSCCARHQSPLSIRNSIKVCPRLPYACIKNETILLVNRTHKTTRYKRCVKAITPHWEITVTFYLRRPRTRICQRPFNTRIFCYRCQRFTSLTQELLARTVLMRTTHSSAHQITCPHWKSAAQNKSFPYKEDNWKEDILSSCTTWLARDATIERMRMC